MPLDQTRVERILERLEPDDAAWLTRLLDQRTSAQRRLEQRDEAVRQVWPYVTHLPPTVAAKRLARSLDRYLTTRWRHEQLQSELPDDAEGLHRALHRIVRANEGRPLGWRQLLNIRAGHRGA